MSDLTFKSWEVRRRVHLAYLSVVGGFALVLVALLFIYGIPSGSVYNSTPVTLSAIFFGSLVSLYPFVRNIIYEKDLLDPSVVIGGLLFAYFPLRAFSINVLGLPPAYPSFIAAADELLSPFTTGLIIISFGSIALYAGHRLALRGRRRAIWPSVDRRSVLMPNLLIIWALSVALHLLRTLEVVGTGNAILYHLTSWHYLAVLVLLAAYFRSSHYRVPRVLLGLILCVEVTLVTAIEFDLSSLLMLLTFSTLAYHYLGPGITARKIMVIGGGIVVLFPISGIAERVQAGHSLPEVLSQGTLGTFWGLQRFLGRMIGTDALTMIVAWTPEPVRFQGGETLLFAIYGLIPRAIWSGKPSIIMCAANNRYFSGRGADANTCAAMTVPGELYWNFGALGILIGLFAIGLLLGLVYRWFKNGNGGPRNYALLVVYSLVLLQIMRFESGFGQVVSNLVKGLGFAAIFLWLVTEPRGGGAFIFDGKSAFERSQVYKVSRSLSSTFSPSSSVVYSGSKQWYRWAKKLPQKSATTLESCQLVSSASSISQRLSVIWFELRTTLCKAWETSGVQSVLESSRTYRLVKRLH